MVNSATHPRYFPVARANVKAHAVARWHQLKGCQSHVHFPDSDEDVEVIAERPAPHSARTKQKLQEALSKGEYVPITLSDVEFEVVSAPAATAGHKASSRRLKIHTNGTFKRRER